MIEELNKIECITLFVEDVNAARSFYQSIFGLKTIYEDQVSAVVKMENVLLNLLQSSESAGLVAPTKTGAPSLGPRLMFTIKVSSVDAVCAKLGQHQVKLLNGPVDRPWGRRTAAFLDPAGNCWEVAQEIS